MQVSLELIDAETMALSFPFDAATVSAIKILQNRRWNPKKKRWEVHLSHLPEVMRILGLTPRDIDEKILDIYRRGWIKCKLKVELGPLEGRLAGSGAPLKEIDAATSFYVPGYKYSSKFIEKKWDGKKHLLNRRNQTFPTGLWPRVRKVLKLHETEYELSRGQLKYERGKGQLVAGPPKVNLRPYQQQALEAALKSKRGIIQIATGGGKTLLAAHLLREVGVPAFFFVHTRDLLYQSAEVFRRELGMDVGILGDGQASLRPLTVATIQTAVRVFEMTKPAKPAKKKIDPLEEETAADGSVEREEQYFDLDEATREQFREAIETVGMVIFDECHHVPADTFYKIAMKTTQAVWRFGLSATPWRDDHHDLLLEAALGPKISVIKCSDLIDQGFLVAPEILVVKAPRPQGNTRGMRYAECYQFAIVENQDRNRMIAAQAADWAAQGLSVLILVAHVAHGQALKKYLPEANFAYGLLDTAERQRYLRELEQKLQPILIATTLADEGLDVPSLGAVILAGGGKSETRAYQRIGRALRPAAGKQSAFVLDFLDQVPYLREHSAARLELYRQEPRFNIKMQDGADAKENTDRH